MRFSITIISLSMGFLCGLPNLWCDELEDLKAQYLSLVDKCKSGLLYLDDREDPLMEFYQKNRPGDETFNCHLEDISLEALRDLYLDLVKRSIRGLFTIEEDLTDPMKTLYYSFRYSQLSENPVLTLRKLMEDVENNHIAGDFIETGVWKGGATILMKAFLTAKNNQERTVWVADSFEGWPESAYPDGKAVNNTEIPWIVVPLEAVKKNFSRYGFLDKKVQFLKGFFKDSLPTAPIEKLAILRIDGDLYESTIDALNALYPKLSVGGYVIIDDYDCFLDSNKAVEEYRTEHGITEPFYKQAHFGIYWKKSEEL